MFSGLLLLTLVAGAFGTTTPGQIHIAFAGDLDGVSDGVAVSWFTSDSTATSTVKYGSSASELNSTFTGSAVQYLEDAGYHHHAVTTGLAPGRQYYFSCGDSAGGFSTPRAFTTAPPANAKSFSVSIFGDLGYGKDGNALETRKQLTRVESEYDWILHVGDISYADDYFTHDPIKFGYENVYNEYMQDLEPIVSTKQYMVLPGNHESSCHSPICLLHKKYRDGLGNFTAYNSRFRMPAAESDAHGANMWYSFNYASVHFIAFDSETDFAGAPEEHHDDSHLLPAGGFAPDGAQIKWLEADLAKANATRGLRPWVVCVAHRPIYTIGSVDSNGNPTGDPKVLQGAIEDLLEKYNVDMFISGHVHAYGRSLPVYQGKVDPQPRDVYTNPKYTTHLVVGGAGCDEMKNKEVSDEFEASIPWSVTTDYDHYGMGILDVNATSLKWRWLASSDNTVLDEFVITKH